ncbi:large ribosomal subunit protein uL13m-like [Watersipora subatra]|uniref:large ribosomal subunit protein uL13m-like n=1 Tax=Watersipora subatra TaxID=2589382 RepID=UPI00355BCCFF
MAQFNKMSDRRRVLQWGTFARTWWIYDANHQCPFRSGNRLAIYLQGKHKPIYHPLADCGDHVVVINSHHISMPDRFWRAWRHMKHLGYAGSFTSERAWQVHRKDPTQILRKQIYSTLTGNLLRKGLMARLHIYPEQDVPDHIMNNVSNQIRQVMPVPKTLDEYTTEEMENFPLLFEWPKGYKIDDGPEFEKLKEYFTEKDSEGQVK